MQSSKKNLFRTRRISTPRSSAIGITAALCVLLLFQSCQKLVDIFDPDSQIPSHGIDLKLVADSIVSPLGVVAAPDSGKHLFVIDQIGKIWMLNGDSSTMTIPFLDISAKLVQLNPNYDERGLLGLAFHPDYKTNHKFYVYYNAPPRPGGPGSGASWDNLSRISEFMTSAGNPNMADPNSERMILEIDDPQSNHNGGTLAFGPTDGYLYISIGDGGAADDVAPGHVEDWYPVNAGGNGQDISANLFGNILRIDVNSGTPYGIPSDNPYVSSEGNKGEIYAYGFRNPYRMSFDMAGAHNLYVGDAGQVLWEEISVVQKGGNYGWNVKEGTHCFNTDSNLLVRDSCPDRDTFGNLLIDPVIELPNWQNPAGGKATTIIGGNVYRGLLLPALYGKYIFGTFSQNFTAPNGELFMSTPSIGSGLWSFSEISLKSSPNDIGYYLKGFGQDHLGEIYLTVSSNLGPSGNTGKVFKLVPAK